MIAETFTVYGVTYRSYRRGARQPGTSLAQRSTREEAEKAAEEIRWRGSFRPTRIVRTTPTGGSEEVWLT